MSGLREWASAAGDRINPVAIKEFRQAVRSRLVVVVLMLFLLINVVILCSFLLRSADAPTSATAGRDVFTSLFALLLGTCMLFVPLYTGGRLSLERNDANLDLLYVSTITAGAIIRGKYLAAMGLTLLIYSACMPCIVFTYLLRGIDLPTIFYILAIGFLVCAAANALGVLAGCVPGGLVTRGLVALGMLFVLFYSIGGTIGALTMSLYWGRSPFAEPQFWSWFGTAVLMEVLGIGLLHVLSVALISPKASNRMFIPRLYVMGCWVVAGIVFLVWSWTQKALEPLTAWMVGSGIVFCCLAVLALGERDSWSLRVRRRIPRNPLLRLVAFPLYTGSAGGIVWCTLLFGATLAAARAWSLSGFVPSARDKDFLVAYANIMIVFGYILSYCLTTVMLRMAVLRKLSTTYLPVVAMLLGVTLSLGPYLVGFFVMEPGSLHRDSTAYLMGSPMILSVVDHDAGAVVGRFLTGWVVVGSLASIPWLWGQWRRFTPYSAAANSVRRSAP